MAEFVALYHILTIKVSWVAAISTSNRSRSQMAIEKLFKFYLIIILILKYILKLN